MRRCDGASMLTIGCGCTGNDEEGGEIRNVPVKTVEKTSTHTAKRNTDGLAPAKGPVTGGSRRGGAAVGGNEAGA